MPVQFEDCLNFTAQINRGGLFAPQEHVFYLGQLCWRVYFELKETPALKLKMLQANQQRPVFCALIHIFVDEVLHAFIGKIHCTRGHNVVHEISARFFNTMSKDFVKESSDIVVQKKKRKIEKMSGVTSS